MIALVRKECHSLIPFFGLSIFIALSSFVYECFTERIDMRPLSETASTYVPMETDGIAVVFLVAFSLASGLLVREHDEGTIEFLDSLPVSRTRIFLVKILLALLVLFLIPLLHGGISIILQAFSLDTLHPDFHWTAFIAVMFLSCVQAVVFFSLGLALSYLRRFGWILAGMLFWLVIYLQNLHPMFSILNTFSLPELQSQSAVVLPVRLLIVQSSIAVFLLIVSYGIFVGIGDQLLRVFRIVSATIPGRIVLVMASAGIAVLSLSLITYLFKDEFEESGDPTAVSVVYPSWNTTRATTERCEFVYPSNLSSRAEAVIAKADETHAAVVELLQAEVNDKITVDMTLSFGSHAGIAFWKTLRMDLQASEDVQELIGILGHELTHVYIESIGNSRPTDHFNEVRFFHEGLATYVQYSRFLQPEKIDEIRLVAATMKSRDQVNIRELVDNEKFMGKNDTLLVYPLGEAFVAAMVERYGESSIAKLLRSFDREGVPQNLTGLDYWRDLFQASGLNFDETIDTYHALLEREVERHRATIDSLPRLKASVELDTDYVYISAEGAAPDGWAMACIFRDRVDTEQVNYVPGTASSPGKFRVRRRIFSGSAGWYQIGWKRDQAMGIYEQWQQFSIR